MTDFTTLSAAEVAAFLVLHQGEIDAEGITQQEVLEKVSTGRAALEARPYGFALIELKPTVRGGAMPHLWVLYVDPDKRGQRLGHRFMREILRKYSNDYHMSLYCHGARRRRFFGSLGFRIESADGEYRRMTTNRDRR